jgi:alpha-1,2-rhamnosyltransferase
MTSIFIECGTTFATTVNTGIQRVVRNIVRESNSVSNELNLTCFQVAFGGDGFYALATRSAHPRRTITSRLLALLLRGLNLLNNSGLFTFPIFARIKRFFSPYVRRLAFIHHNSSHGEDIAIPEPQLESTDISSQKILLLLDSTWDNRIWTAVDEFRSTGGYVCAVLYDLIPFSHPETVAEQTRLAHTNWWNEAPSHIDSVMCISNAVRDDYLAWQEKAAIAHKLPPESIGYFHLGAELKQDDPIITVLNSATPSFLVVGSLEPRKNHAFILDAFDQLWQQNKEVSLVIVGGFGWKSEDLIARIQSHPELGRRLFLIRDASDRDLYTLYNKCEAIIIASLAEGFGLPIVEAFHHGAKVICSDLPVFREIAGDHALYFDLTSSASLANIVTEHIQTPKRETSRCAKEARTWLTWHESTKQLITRLLAIAAASK